MTGRNYTSSFLLLDDSPIYSLTGYARKAGPNGCEIAPLQVQNTKRFPVANFLRASTFPDSLLFAFEWIDLVRLFVEHGHKGK